MIKVIETNNTTHPGGQETTETINHYINEAHIVEIKEAPAPYAMNEVVLDNGTVIETPMSVEELANPYIFGGSAKDYAKLGEALQAGIKEGLNETVYHHSGI